MNNRNQTGLHRAQTWEAAEEDDFRVKTVGEFRVRLLREGVPIKQAAAAIGCGDAFQFSRLFKRTTGLPPSRFLEQAASEG